MRLLFLPIFFLSAIALAQPAEVVFTLEEKDLIPEGIAYDVRTKSFFVGSIHKHKVVRISEKGIVSDFVVSPAVDLGEVLGMKVDASQRRLWVCSNSPGHDSTEFISSVHVFDVDKGTLLKKYQLSGKKKHLFNDLVIATNGDVFITDSDAGMIHVIRKESNSIEEFVKSGTFGYPNGITLTPDEKELIITTGSGLGLVRVDRATRNFTPLRSDRFLLIGMDGLYRYGNSLVAIQNNTFPEAVVRLQCDAEFTRVDSIAFEAFNQAEFDSPTTGVIVGTDFYFIGNSQLLQIVGGKGKLKNPANLQRIRIMRLKLE